MMRNAFRAGYRQEDTNARQRARASGCISGRSGCHWMPMTQRCFSLSIASTKPSLEFATGRSPAASRSSGHPLVVARVDAKHRAVAVDAGEAAVPVHGHLVPAGRAVVVPAVPVALDVLRQRPAERHVQQLVPAADAQHRDVAFERLPKSASSCSSRSLFGRSVFGPRFSP